MARILGVALLSGSLLVGGILLWLTNVYMTEGLVSTAVGLTGAAMGILLLVLPQFVLGVYLLKLSITDTN